MSKSDRILDLFPYFYRAADPNKLLGEVVRNLAQPLEEADTHLFRIQRAHRLPVAEHTEDILNLAATLNLTAFHFEDILNDPALPHSEKLTQMRQRVQRVARLHLLGLGTPWAICEAAAIFLNAIIAPDQPGAPLLNHLDSEGYSHRAHVKFMNSSTFSIGDFLDLPSFANRLSQPSTPVDTWFIEQLSSVTKTALSNYQEQGSDPAALQAGLLQDLNLVIRGPSIYEAQRFADVNLHSETQMLLSENAQGDDLIRLNRLLIEDAYPLELSRSQFKNRFGKSRGQIILHENPWRRRKIDPAERWQLDSWLTENESVTAAPVRIAIQGHRDHTVFPSVFCPETGEGILFRGIVPHGQTLLLDATEGATLEDDPVDDWVISFHGIVADYSRVPAIASEDDGADQPYPFDGDREVLEARPFQPKSLTPQASVGRSTWIFKIAEGVYNGPSLFDFACFATTGDPIGTYDGDRDFDACVYDYPPCGIVGMAWEERISCAFKLLLPPPAGRQAHSPSATDSIAGPRKTNAVPNPSDFVSTILPRFKPAGIRAFVDTASDTWIVGTSVLRNNEARDGEGIEFDTTTLHGPKHDMLVS